MKKLILLVLAVALMSVSLCAMAESTPTPKPEKTPSPVVDEGTGDSYESTTTKTTTVVAKVDTPVVVNAELAEVTEEVKTQVLAALADQGVAADVKVVEVPQILKSVKANQKVTLSSLPTDVKVIYFIVWVNGVPTVYSAPVTNGSFTAPCDLSGNVTMAY